MNRTLRLLRLGLLLLIHMSSCVFSRQTFEDPVIIGHQVKMHSSIYDKDITLFISLPEGYDSEETAYPTLFTVQSYPEHVAVTVKDLSQRFIPPMIYVHVVTYNSRDLIPASISGENGDHGAERMIAFFEKELFPFIENQYRTQPFRILQSGSWGGIFCLYTLLNRPDLINAVIASTPWLIWGQKERLILDSIKEWMVTHSFKNHFLYTTIGNDPEEGLQDSFVELGKILDSFPQPGLRFSREPMPDEDHYSITHKAVWEGLKWIFSEWNHIPTSNILEGEKGLDRYAEHLKTIYGYNIGLSATPVWSEAWRFMQKSNFVDAIKCFKSFIVLSPNAPYAYEGLGRALEANGELEKALIEFEKSVKIATDNGGDFGRYNAHVNRIKKKLMK